MLITVFADNRIRIPQKIMDKMDINKLEFLEIKQAGDFIIISKIKDFTKEDIVNQIETLKKLIEQL